MMTDRESKERVSRRGDKLLWIILAGILSSGSASFRSKSELPNAQVVDPVKMASIPAERGLFGRLPFTLDVTEVTVAAYAACVTRGLCSATRSGEHCNGDQKGVDNHPINCLTWDQAAAYCAAVGKRLPTDAEWTWAAGGGPQSSTYPWGEDPPRDEIFDPQLCWKRDEYSLHPTCPIASFPPGAFGLFDMEGNVAEWTSDTVGPGELHHMRGSSWGTKEPNDVGKKGDIPAMPSRLQHVSVGFRCAR
jgi:sulfatase modifying factor 1